MIEEADRLEKMGAVATALEIYGDALSELVDRPLLVRAFDGFFRLQSDSDAVIRAYRVLSPKIWAEHFPPGLSLRMGWLFELSGDLEEAAALYRREFSDHRTASALDAAARLEIEMNDTPADVGTAGSYPDGHNGIVSGYRALQLGDPVKARRSFAQVLDSPWSQEAQLQAMYGLFLAALPGKDPGEIHAAAELLGASFPLSPEYAIARVQGSGGGTGAPRIFLASVPGQFLDNDLRDGPPPLTETPPGSSSTTQSGQAQRQDGGAIKPAQRVSIQVGAYQMRENADDMVSELKKRGFPAEVRQISISGKAFYKAFAAVSLEETRAKDLLVRLREEGFEGYLLPE
jgi:hypothetical protein